MSYCHAHYNPVHLMHPIQYPEFLFRVIRAYDVDPDTGFQCGDPAAGLTFERHIRKGFNNNVKSQFISTTKSLRTAISWTLNEHSAFAIISCRALNRDIRVYDLSGDCSQVLTSWANYISTHHQEVLLTPCINEKAVIGIVKYSSHGSWIAMNSCVQRLLSQYAYCRRRVHDDDSGDRCEQLDLDYAVDVYHSIRCGYCGEPGHDVDRGDRCEELEVDNAVDVYHSIRCGYCGEPGHDVDRGDRCEELEVDNAVDVYYSIRCGYCGEPGHDVDRGNRCEELEVDNAVDVYYSIRCGYCGEPGHDVDRGDRCEELELENAVDVYYSTRCGYCGEPGHDVDSGDRCIEFDFDNAVADFHSLNAS